MKGLLRLKYTIAVIVASLLVTGGSLWWIDHRADNCTESGGDFVRHGAGKATHYECEMP